MGERDNDMKEHNNLCIWKTPVHKISGWEACGNRIYMKRDDLLGFSFGGNKVRFAHAFFEDLQKKNCDSMIIYGNYHSNLCRILSVLCKSAGLPCYMIYNIEDIEEEDESINGKLILDMDVTPFPCKKSTIAQTVRKAMDELKEKGYRPYYIYGNEFGAGNELIPLQSYVNCYEEILSQAEEQGVALDYIVTAASTNATQSGLTIGSILHPDGPKVIGVSVNRKEERGIQVVQNNIRLYFEQKGQELPDQWEKNITFTDHFLNGGYGQYCPEIEETIKTMYRNNGIGLDPTYTGKGFWGMLGYLKEQGIEDKNVLFLHTGGTPLFFDYMRNR